MTSLLVAGSGNFVACSGYDLDEERPSWLGSSIYNHLKVEGKFTHIVKLIDDLDYATVLAQTGSKTLFVADDDAFARFFANNNWGVSGYSDLTLAQKKLLLNSSMINNSYQISSLSSTEGPTEGECLRRMTSASTYDSVPLLRPTEMPSTTYWDRYRGGDYTVNGEVGILCMKDITTAPMIHFLEKQLIFNKITNDDYNFLFNGTTNRVAGEASINGVTVRNANIKCLNGFTHEMDEVITPLDNMAELIRTKTETSEYSKLLERFCAPYYNATATREYNRLYETSIDSVFEKRYFSQRSQGGDELILTPDGAPVKGSLRFDPGWNQYYNPGNNIVTAHVAMQQNMGVMLVPSNEALVTYWNTGAGKVLKDFYHEWDSVPDNVLSRLINNNMLSSFIGSVPSKFETVLNDASIEMGITTQDIDRVYLGCNGAVYVTNKVFSPTAYASVSFPALINKDMNIIYWAIEQLEYYAYLNSMDSYYSFFIPTNAALENYIDPVSYGQTQAKLYRFYYDETSRTEGRKVRATIYNYDMESGERGDSIGDATQAQILDRMEDILDYHTIVGNVEDGSTYYRTKGNGTIKIVANTGIAEQMQVQGSYQTENGVIQTIRQIYDESKEGNGKSYILRDAPMMTARNSVYDVLVAHEEFSKFLEMMNGTGYFETLHGAYACGSTNVSLFNTYHYTVYVPTNASIQALIDEGKLPIWDEIEEETDAAIKDSLTEVIQSFIKYHIQDNSLYIGSGYSEGNYETAMVNYETERFHRLNAEANNNGITIRDNVGNVRRVVTSSGLYNLMAREYQYNNRDAQRATEIETSAWAVIHQIDGPLFFSTTQFEVNE